MTNIFQRAAQLAHGVEVITQWLGEGGQVAEYSEAQGRAITCMKCPKNELGVQVATPVAMAIKKYLSVKNGLNLRVQGEKRLGQCNVCGCQIKLLIWENGDRLKNHMTEEETRNSPEGCWKLKL